MIDIIKILRLLVKKIPVPVLSQLGLKVIFPKAVCGLAVLIKASERKISFARKGG